MCVREVVYSDGRMAAKNGSGSSSRGQSDSGNLDLRDLHHNVDITRPSPPELAEVKDICEDYHPAVDPKPIKTMEVMDTEYGQVPVVHGSPVMSPRQMPRSPRQARHAPGSPRSDPRYRPSPRVDSPRLEAIPVQRRELRYPDDSRSSTPRLLDPRDIQPNVGPLQTSTPMDSVQSSPRSSRQSSPRTSRREREGSGNGQPLSSRHSKNGSRGSRHSSPGSESRHSDSSSRSRSRQDSGSSRAEARPAPVPGHPVDPRYLHPGYSSPMNSSKDTDSSQYSVHIQDPSGSAQSSPGSHRRSGSNNGSPRAQRRSPDPRSDSSLEQSRGSHDGSTQGRSGERRSRRKGYDREQLEAQVKYWFSLDDEQWEKLTREKKKALFEICKSLL